MTQITWIVGMQCVNNNYVNILSVRVLYIFPYKCTFLWYCGIPVCLGAPLATPGLAGTKTILSVPCYIRIDSDLFNNIYMYKSFDFSSDVILCNFLKTVQFIVIKYL